MDAYSWTMVGLMVFSFTWTPVVIAAWVGDRQVSMGSDPVVERTDLERVMPAYQPVTQDIRGSVGIAVARRTGQRLVGPMRTVYVYAARHASRMWDRPSGFVRRHAATGRGYYDTLSSVLGDRNFLGDNAKYKPRHGGGIGMGIAC